MIYKVEKCRVCGYKRKEESPKEAGACPKCSGPLSFSDNWYIDYYVSGRRRTEAVSPRRKDAEDAYAKKRVDIREGRYWDKVADITWESAKKNFCAWMLTNVMPNTKRMYDNSLLILDPHFRGMTLNQIRPADVERFKGKRLKEGVKAATVNRDLATIKRLYSLAEDNGDIEVNRMRKVKLLKEGDGRIRVLTAEERGKLMENAKVPWLRMAILVALNTGMRKETIVTLRWPEIDFRGDFILKPGAKGGKTARIPLAPSLKAELASWKNGQAVMSQWVFSSPDDPAKHVHVRSHTTWDAALENAGIKDFRFHDLRHCFATDFLRATGDLNALRDILGHADLKMVLRYAHVLDDHKKEAMEKFDAKATEKKES